MPHKKQQVVGSRPPTKQIVRGGHGSQQVVGEHNPPFSELAPPVTVAPPTSELALPVTIAAPNSILQGLRNLNSTRSQRPAPRTGPANTLASRNTKTSRISPNNTFATGVPDRFGRALAKRRSGAFTSDNPRELRLRVAAIRNTF